MSSPTLVDGGVEEIPAAAAGSRRGLSARVWPSRAGAATALIVAVGIVLRFAAPRALWLDEAISVDIARLPVRDIGGALRHDGHPPLYYVLLHAWTGIFGDSPVAARAMSGVISIAALPFMWAAGCRLGGRRTATLAVVLLATSPFAIRYAGEARMYSLVTLLALAGALAVWRALEAPRGGRLAAVAVMSALLLLSQYWALYLVAATLVLLGWAAWRDRSRRAAAVKVAAAVAAGGIAFLPWLSAFLYQAKHTGTPWGRSIEPFDAVFDTILDFGGGKWAVGRVVGPALAGLVGLALFARLVDRHRVEVDVRTVPGVRWELAVVGVAGAMGATAALLTGSTYQSRYAAGLLPFVVLAAAIGIEKVPGRALRGVVVGVLVVGGLAGAAREASTPRTQAAEVADALNAQATPGDVVAFCPDQLEPSVHRRLDPGIRELTFPTGSPPGRVDWVDYKARIRASDPVAFARAAVREAGPAGTVWLVSSPRYRGFGERCAAVAGALTNLGRRGRVVVPIDSGSYEKQQLARYRVP